MGAVAGDFHAVFRVFTALAAMLFVVCHGAPACRMRALLRLSMGHDINPSITSVGAKKSITCQKRGSGECVLAGAEKIPRRACVSAF